VFGVMRQLGLAIWHEVCTLDVLMQVGLLHFAAMQVCVACRDCIQLDLSTHSSRLLICVLHVPTLPSMSAEKCIFLGFRYIFISV